MTEQRRREIRAELARRMGIPESKWPSRCRVEGHRIDDDGFSEYCYTCGEAVHLLPQAPPDPFTDAADKDALVKWLAADDDRWFTFIRHLIKLVNWPPSAPKAITDPTFAEVVSEVRYLMTASCETITLAAARALGIQEAGNDND